MLILVRGKDRPSLNNITKQDDITQISICERTYKYAFDAFDMGTSVILSDEFSRWSDVEKYIGLACIFKQDIHIIFTENQNGLVLDLIGFWTYIRNSVMPYDLKVTYETKYSV